MRKYGVYFLVVLVVSLVLFSRFKLGDRHESNTYQNPVYTPVLADPTVILADDGYYYAYGTEDAWGDHARTVPIPIIKSKDLVKWTYVGPAFEEKPTWKVTGDLWAPEIIKHEGNYLLFYSYSRWGDDDPGIGLATAKNPAGPFNDLGKLFTSREIGVTNSIDPFLIFENDTPYLFWGSFHGIYGVALTDDLKAVLGEPKRIADEQYEAVYLKRHENQYVFFGSRGSCCEGPDSTYNVAVGKADNLFGPYRDQTGVDLNNGGGTLLLEGSDQIAGPGHNTLVTDKSNNDFLIYHGIVKDEPYLWTGASRRPLMIDKIIWQEGWPTIENKQPSLTKKTAPDL